MASDGPAAAPRLACNSSASGGTRATGPAAVQRASARQAQPAHAKRSGGGAREEEKKEKKRGGLDHLPKKRKRAVEDKVRWTVAPDGEDRAHV